MNPDDISKDTETVQESNVKKVPKAPDKKKFEARHEEISRAIKEKEAQLRGVSQKPDETVQEKLRALRSEKEAMIGKRKKIDSDMRMLNQDVSKKNADLTKVQGSLQGYKSESRIDEAIQRLEDQLKRNNFKISEERKIVAEIDLLRRSKKALTGFTTVKRELDAMRDQLRSKRGERDQCYKVVTSLKQKEEELKRSIHEEKLLSENIKKELEELKEQRRMITQEQRVQEKEYAGWRNEQRRSLQQQQRRKREEERMYKEQQYIRDMAEYEASREPYADQKQLCTTLITYLQSLIPPDQNDITGDSQGDSQDQTEFVDLAQSFEKEGLVLLKKKEENLFTGKPRSNKRSKKDKRRNKPLVHTPQTLSQFQQMEIKAPAALCEVNESIQQLTSKKAYYDSLPPSCDSSARILDSLIHSDQNSAGGAPSVTESAFNESIPSTPEVQLDSLAPSFPPDGVRRLSHDSGACELEGQEEPCVASMVTDDEETGTPLSCHSNGDSSASSATTVMELDGQETDLQEIGDYGSDRISSIGSVGEGGVGIDRTERGYIEAYGSEIIEKNMQTERDSSEETEKLGKNVSTNNEICERTGKNVKSDTHLPTDLNCVGVLSNDGQIKAEPKLNNQFQAKPCLIDGQVEAEPNLSDRQVEAEPNLSDGQVEAESSVNDKQLEAEPILIDGQVEAGSKLVSEVMQDMTLVCDKTTDHLTNATTDSSEQTHLQWKL